MGRKFYLSLVILILSVSFASAQTGEIRGTITEKGGKEPVPFASVAALSNGIQVLATSTDIDGKYTIKPLNPGTYEIKATAVGYQPVTRPGVLVTVDKISFVDVEMGKGVNLQTVEIVDYAVPLLDKGVTAQQKTVTFEEIQAAPTRSVNSIAVRAAGVFQKDEDEGINVRGSRDDATAYYIDGIKVRGNVGLPQKGTEQITVITGGIPAQYGDATGGIISVTTRGPSSEYSGGFELATSEKLDAYGYNLASANITGPLFKEVDENGKKTGQSIAGFFIAGEYQYDKDPNPSVIPAYKLKDDLLADLRLHPLVRAPQTPGGAPRNDYISNASFFTKEDFVSQKYRENVAAKAIRLNAKLDVRPVKNLVLTFGGSLENVDDREYTRIYSLLNYNNNTQKIQNNWRAFAKLTQRFSSEGDKASSAIKNAFYTIQVDYSRNKETQQNADLKDNIFSYGYIGKFKSSAIPSYSSSIVIDSTGSISHINAVRDGNVDTSVVFTPGTANPYGANYTSQYFDLTAPLGRLDYTDNLSSIQNKGGLLNGDNRINQNVYSLYATTGRVASGYSITDERQARISASGSADIKNHNIVIGLEYEQRTDRGFTVFPNDLWTQMRQLGNQNLIGGEESSAFTIDTNFNGIPLTVKDYIRGQYVQASNSDSEKVIGFYENVRVRTGLSLSDTIQIDNYDPSKFSLDLFSPDELIANNNDFVRYYGYDYTGKEQTSSSWNLNDFYVKKDKNNNFLRKIDAFRPTYIAGYISDKFTFNDIIFNVGLRVDRFDANQKVLLDPYLLYETRTAGDPKVKEIITNAYIPGNIGKDYAVYVNNSENPTSIVGFRNGSVWYNSSGSTITDLKPLVQGVGSSGGIQPFLVNHEDYQRGRVNPNAFGDYEPQVTVMPRIAFSFPISDEAYFAAHYDLLTQRPQDADYVRFNPISYLRLAQKTLGSSSISNPNLKPEKTTEYEINFQQKLSRSSAFSIAAFYKQLRDNIQIINVDYAFPIDYSTYGNVDFGTVKGLTFGYDLRRTNNIRMTISYTLQFADGTGSDNASSSGILSQAGQTNLREVKPLTFDQRHTFITSFDYHYGSGKNYDGPVWFNKQFLANAGISLDFHAGSGTPYTRKSNVTPEADFTTTENSRNVIAGSINGSRHPWNFKFDLKVDKDFEIKTGKRVEGESRKSIYANLYLQILNVLNTENVIAVYKATGSPSDDGYISNPASQTKISQYANPQSYIDMYGIAVNNPSNYSLPRRIRLGIQFNF